MYTCTRTHTHAHACTRTHAHVHKHPHTYRHAFTICRHGNSQGIQLARICEFFDGGHEVGAREDRQVADKL